MTKRKRPIFKLDAQEQELSDSFDRGEWKSVKNPGKEQAKTRKAPARHLSKDARVNIRISSSDLERLKQLAAYEGLPYQSLIASVLHKYAAGHLHADRHD